VQSEYKRRKRAFMAEGYSTNSETKCYRNQAVNGYKHDRTTKRFASGNGVPSDSHQAMEYQETAIVTEQPSDSDQAMEYQEAAIVTD